MGSSLAIRHAAGYPPRKRGYPGSGVSTKELDKKRKKKFDVYQLFTHDI
jgi:hypothetical protein